MKNDVHTPGNCRETEKLRLNGGNTENKAFIHDVISESNSTNEHKRQERET